ncbi:MAG: 4Fe-4S binding protein [Thermoprotei archaeon]|jgi:pyruvate ferredoxin oxidoreductase delta subunit
MSNHLPTWQEVTDAGTVFNPPNSILLNKTGGWRTFRPIIDQAKCIDCRICLLVCPDSVITRKEAQVGKHNYEYDIDYDFCKGCLVCENECPAKAITHVEEEK